MRWWLSPGGLSDPLMGAEPGMSEAGLGDGQGVAPVPDSASVSAGDQRQGAASPAARRANPRISPAGRIVAALLLVALLGVVLTLVTMSALATQRPQLMPFGVTGSSPVVTAAQSQKLAGYQMSFVNRLYANENDVMNAINQGTIYGAYIPGTSSDTLLVVPSKSFFATFVITGVFEGTAKKLGRPLNIQSVKPLPKGRDPYGVAVGLLLLPLLVGGLLSALLVFKATGLAAGRWRVATLLGFSIVAALLTLVIAGPVFGAIAGDRFWPLLPCAVLVEVTVAAVTALLIAVVPGFVGILLAAMMFIVIGLPLAGQTGVQMLSPYWQAIGGALPPRYGADLIQNVLYFSSNNITTPIIVLAVYALIPILILGYLEWLRPRRKAAAGGQSEGSPPAGSRGRQVARVVVVVLVIAAVDQSLFASNFTSSGHNPVANNLPFAVVGSSPLVSGAEKSISLKVTSYPSESAAKNAIAEAKAWGALIPGTPNTLLNVGTQSDLAPLPIAEAFQAAAKSLGQKLTTQTYNPTPLASGDPYGIVLSIVLTPLLICGYLSATMLRTATGVAADRWRGLIIMAFAIVMALVLDLIACTWFNGIPSDKFWIVWAIMALIVAVVGLFAAVMGRLLGAAGTLVTVIVIILFGKPSAGGANGVPFLPGFWLAIGPYLPPRNAYILLKNTVYFGGNGTSQALIILLAYFVVFAVILGILDWRRRPGLEAPISRETEESVAATAVPAGVAI
jgi:hypothetical protein